MKAWLKGGIIGVGIILLYIIVMSLISIIKDNSEIYFLLAGSPLLIVSGFIIGALIGLIVSKLKKH